jgi:hypothetical protein
MRPVVSTNAFLLHFRLQENAAMAPSTIACFSRGLPQKNPSKLSSLDVKATEINLYEIIR